MFSFFRRIRRNLANDNQFLKYSRYAIGEIVLVVIGILIALQINIKNEERKDRNKEKIILETLLSDLKTNKELVDEGFIDYNWKSDLSEKMANYFGKEHYEKNLVLTDSIIYWSAEYTAIELINTSIISLATSERLELLQNETLKQQIVRYPTYIELYKERENLVRSIVINDIRFKIGKYLSLQKWWDIPESFESDYLGLFKDRELSNDYLNKLFQTQDALERLKNLNNVNNLLIGAINMELEDRFY